MLEALSKGDGLYQTWLKENKVTKKELNPVKSVEVSDDKKHVTIRLATGETKKISFE